MYGHGVWDTICIFNRWNPACTGMGCGTPYAYSIGGTQHVRAWGVGCHAHMYMLGSADLQSACSLASW